MNNNEKFPYLFLDLDGCITTPPNYRDFNPECVKNLKYIIKETGCRIVVHSTWRKFENNRNLFLYLWGKWGFDLNDFYKFLPILSGDKVYDIEEFLENNKQIVDNYVIIDDEDYNFPPEKHIQPRYVGLSFEEAKRAIEILNG